MINMNSLHIKLTISLLFVIFITVSCEKGNSGDNSNNNLSYQDLSISGTANCYIVSQEGQYKFKAVKGNGTQSVGAVAKAEVLWESYGTDVAPKVGALVKSATYSDGYIGFETSDSFTEGNAVIAAYDADDNVLWSWHIWLTEQPEDLAYHFYNDSKSEFTDYVVGVFMDRNLGAISATQGSVGALGLHYQWGRKDPFLGSSSIHKASMAIAKSTLNWPAGIAVDLQTGTVEYSIAHPATYLYALAAPYDWCYSERNDQLWQSEKTIYDPCPAGWRVPDGGSTGQWRRSKFMEGTYDSLFEGVAFHISQSSVTWYPLSGARSFANDKLWDVGDYGGYWSATVINDVAFCLWVENTGKYNPSSTKNRALGLPVRCMKENL